MGMLDDEQIRESKKKKLRRSQTGLAAGKATNQAPRPADKILQLIQGIKITITTQQSHGNKTTVLHQQLNPT
jgi:hypothetical protein